MKPGGRGAGYESAGMAGPTTPGTSLQRQQEEMTEGWDVHWDTPLEPKYECPICLMGLREPVQTNCGHRFCRYCILKSIRDAGARCPIDNSPLTEDQIFPDNFAKREILALRVKCSNKGCKEKMELRELDAHLRDCKFAFVRCPLECGDTFWRKDIPEHMENDCPRRLVKCHHCFKEVPFDQQEIHLEQCPNVVRPCEFCQQQLTNEQMMRHVANECARAPVLCIFSTVGCNVEKMERRNLAEHLQEFTQVHLRLLLNVLRALKDVRTHRPGNHSDPQSLPARMADVLYEHRRHLPLLPEQQTLFLPHAGPMASQVSHGPIGSELPHGVDQGGDGIARLSHSMQQMVLPAADFFQPRLGETTWTSAEEREQEHYIEPVVPATCASPYPDVASPYTAAAAMGAHAYAHMEGSSGYRTDASSVGTASRDSGAPRSEDSSLADARVLRTKVHQHETRIVEQQHYIRELELKLGSLQQKYSDLEEKTKERMCNGTYIWRIKEYSKLRQQAVNGAATVRHSSGFYTSYYGYKLCVRVNLNGVDSAHGTHISLFIHFMMGENDDILEWPFQGKITLSILDQNPNQKQNHITETLASKPSYAAFQRPTTLRNHKGFGYMEFALLRSLENGQYIKNDTLIIKCMVQPQ
ncbi:TRAF6 [Branchiostoma lanceolatum]|uniref:RING-type E3 ubiquitin transferase n=1 Tax=Branchiostoma lanceolatum TaxID=7740 RepID=A0A8J9ZLS2_BRALA|nr:TRAF6 [Branchiostoma lanceolatum]